MFFLIKNFSYSDDEIAFAYPMKRGPSELQLSRECPEVQEENRKILQTIENALKQLNIVSVMTTMQLFKHMLFL